MEPPHSDAKNALDLRLAKGEISVAEYTTLLSLIQRGSSNSAVSGPGALLLSIESKKLHLFENAFSQDHVFYNYESVRRLSFATHKLTVNLIPTSHLTGLSFGIENGPSFEIMNSAAFFKGKIGPRIQEAYRILSDKSYSGRSNFYARALGRDGSIEIGGVKLLMDRVIQSGSIRIDLELAQQERRIHRGTFTRTGIPGLGPRTWSHDPTAIIVESGKPGEHISFSFPYDEDVLRPIFDGLARYNPGR